MENMCSLEREKELEDENSGLQDQVTDLAKEIKLVKQLMMTLFASRKQRRV